MTPTTTINGRPVGAVVVTYFPDDGMATRLAAVRREFGPVIVVDNTAEPATAAGLRAVCESLHCELIANPVNRGLAGALNQGFESHAKRGLEWAVAFDQDSTPTEGFGSALANTAASDPRPAVVGANWIDEAHPDRPSRHLRPHPGCGLFFCRSAAGNDLDDVTSVIASGSMFDLSLWSELRFDEDLFLDLVDTDYCLRARRRDRPIRVAAAARLAHRRGAKRAVGMAGRTFFPAFMPPVRLHYLFRNRLRLLARHARFAPHLFTFECVYATKILAEIILLEDHKLAKLAACGRGIRDGMTGRKGPIAATR